MAQISCGGSRPTQLGVRDTRLAPCPRWPNCVSSDATDAVHAIAPLALKGEVTDAWASARDVIAGLARTRVITETPEYLHAECQSALLGFVDDVELHLHASDGLIAVRSASRLGFGDLGVNRRRIEDLRAALAQLGVVE
jgi:uncharacterized protein (DUF1499 family)